MANNKKKNIQLGIDLQVQNYDAAIKALEAIEKLGGNTGKVAAKLRQELLETKNAIIALGSTTTPQELKKFIKINGDLSDSLIGLGKEFKVTQEQINKIKKEYADASAAVVEYTKKLEEAKKKEKELKKAQLQKADLAVKKLDEPGNEGLKEKVKGRSTNQGKLDKINELKRSKDPDAEKFLAELNLEYSKQKQVLIDVQKEIKAYEDEIDKATKAVEKHEASLKSLKSQHGIYQSVRQSAEEATESINENNEALIRTRDAAVKAGEGQIQVKKSTDEAANSFTRAARSVFNYTILYQGFKKILRESVRTIKEMDDAITGMTVVTNLSREQAWEQVESFEAIAKATSSTMTEIAGLTTEYLKQGRAMKDAKILAEETAKSAKIAGISTAEAVQYMTSAINGFNLSATDATRVSDVFANLAAASATDFEDLAIAVSKVSAQANLAGMSLEYTTALLAKGIETTQEAPESIGTALKTIVARMRELSSYGSVLEDGASVNKVERALASAGIELRDVNGEFRDLEEIFNELGPKWDYLNTMQQQAIAQAVAGTRQQSRFVAIMQDWGRTQELIAEANASEGASAAQYQQYAQGIEAALTRMKTSWEGFVQSLANNKVIIGAVNTATKVIELINRIPGGLKVIIALYAGWMVLHKARENHEIKMKAYRQMAMTDEEKAAQSRKGILDQQREEKENEQQIINKMKTKLALAEKIKEQTLQQKPQLGELAVANDLELVKDKKEKVIKKAKDPNLTDSAKLELQKQYNELVKEEEALTKKINEYKVAKENERKDIIDAIIAKEKELDKAQVKVDVTNAIQEISKLDKEIDELNKKRKSASGDDKAAIEEEIKTKKAERSTKMSETKTAIKESELDDESKNELLGQIKNKDSRAAVNTDEVDANYNNLLKEREALSGKLNNTLTFGTDQWNIKLQESKTKLEEIQQQLQDTSLTDEQRQQLKEAETAELEKQLAIQTEIHNLSSQKEVANKELEAIDTNIEKVQEEAGSEDVTSERKAELEQQLIELNAAREEKLKQINELEYGQVGLLDEQIAKVKELQELKAGKETELGDVQSKIANGETVIENEDGSTTDLLAQEQQLKSDILLIETQSKDLQSQLSEAGAAEIEQLNLVKEIKQSAILDEQTLAEAKAYQMTAQEESMVKENEAQIRKLEGLNEEIALRKSLLEMEAAELNAKLKDNKLSAKERKAAEKDLKKKQKTLNKLNKAEQKNKKAIYKLDQKNQKLQDGTYNIYSKMADIIGNKIGFNIKGMVDDIKTTVTFTKTLVTDFVKFLGQTILRKKIEKETTKEMEEQNAAKNQGGVTDILGLGINKAQEEVEEDTTEEVGKQQTITKGSTLLEKIQLVVAKLTGKEEKKETKEDQQQVGMEAAESVAEAGEQGAAQNYVGMAIGIAGAVAALAMIGLGAAISLGGAGGGGGGRKKSKEDTIAAKQNANYEMKKSNASANKALDEYTELRDKSVRTAEEEQRMEELESEMQELDERFAGLKGEALVKAVRGKVAAQEVAIEDNIQDSFDIALNMGDISDSSVARQAIADKVIASQDKLIDSNVDLLDATEAEINAIKGNAHDMANSLAQDVDWDQAFGTENKNIWGQGDGTYSLAQDYSGWDYVAQGLGSALVGALINPFAGAVLAIGSITEMVLEEQRAKQQQNQMEVAIEKFETASTDMAIAMGTADKDLASQVAAFDDSISDLEKSLEGTSEVFAESAKKIVETQYGTTAFVAKLNKQTDNKLLGVIGSIQEKTKGSVKESALIDMADAIVGSGLKTQSQIDAYNKKKDESMGATSEGWAFFSGTNQEQDLSRIAGNLGLEADASVNEIKNALAKQIKRNDDGTLMVDEDGNYAFKDVGNGFTGNNKELTEIFNNVSNFAEEIGSLADLTETSIGHLNDWNETLVGTGELLIETFTKIDSNLASIEELKSGNTEFKETKNAGYVFADAAYAARDKIVESGEATIAALKAEQDALDDTADNYASQYKALQDSIDQVKNDMNSNSANLLSKTQEAIGYLDDAGWINRAEASSSKRDNLQEIYDALATGGDLTVEQIDLLYDEILPSLQLEDKTMTAEKFADLLSKKDLNSIKLVGDYLENFQENEEMAILNTVGLNRRTMEDNFSQLTKDADFIAQFGNVSNADNLNRTNIENYIKMLREAKKDIPEWYKDYEAYIQSEAEYQASKAKSDIVLADIEREQLLTAEELRKANLEAQIAGMSKDKTKHRLTVIEKELEYNRLLNLELADQLNKKKDLMAQSLSAYGYQFSDLFEISNGQVKVIESVYNSADKNVKEWVTTHLDSLKEVVEAEYESTQTIIELTDEKFTEMLDLQEEFIDAYTEQLEKEQEAIEETLEKRKELYQEYFDWINEQEDEEETQNDIDILRQRIANLTGATDAASLKALKDAQEELEELEKEAVQSEQEKIQEQILDNLDKQSEQVEEYYEQQLEDNQKIINAINQMNYDQKLAMLRSADDYDKQTVEKQVELDQKYIQLLDGYDPAEASKTAYKQWLDANPGATEEEKLAKRKVILGYSSGGLVDYTGPAIVHGTPSKPEAFLNAEQTALFGKLGETLMIMSSQGMFGRLNDISASTINNNLTIENFDITINADMKDDQDLYETGNNLADAFFERIQASGIPVNIKK